MSFRIFTASRHLNLLQRLAYAPRRCYATNLKTTSASDPQVVTPVDAAKVDLPEDENWRKSFPSTPQINHRVSIRNPDTAAKVADAFVPKGSKDKIIIEAFPGPGQLTRALLNLPKGRIKRLIVMEDWEPYLEYLRPLELIDSRIKVVSSVGYAWDSYQIIRDMHLLDDVAVRGWEEGVHPQLKFISHLPSTVGAEQLLSQLFRTMPDRQWLFQYGRVPLSFLLNENIHKRVTATFKDSTRCKFSVIGDAVAEISEPLPHDVLQPFDDHFHPIRLPTSMPLEKKKSSRAVGHPFHTLNVVPREKQIIQKGKMDAWDFCLRRLYVRKATSLKLSLPGLASGAGSLIKKLTDPSLPESERVDVSKPIRALTGQDWAIVLKAFDEWPFAPEDLSIHDSFTSQDRSNSLR